MLKKNNNTAAMSAKIDDSKLFGLRVENINKDTNSETIIKLFSEFGGIASSYRPTKHDTKTYFPYMFIRYYIEQNALDAMAALNGTEVDGNLIVVKYAKQVCFFTQETGYITNTELDNVKAVVVDFDASLPLNHYAKKREEELKKADDFTTVRLDDLPEDIKPEELQDLFGRFGEVTSIYLPFCMKVKSYKNFGFVRFLQRRDAEDACRAMHNSNLGRGRNIQAVISNTKTYFSQDETHYAV